ncbi:MAG: Rpn family recombination-promoting nuclease/putative transposase [Lachnospiraceae bacterium]|nr:Rpn family recombination-promoting nuclease/putative transposase [Lachnospiraceae bacterium]
MTKEMVPEFKNYEELEYRDDFMFGVTMQDPSLCHDVLELLMEQPVGELHEPVSQLQIWLTSDGKPIRLDIYTRDAETVYDAEMQNQGKKSIESLQLPRRSRFYQSSIDMDLIGKGQSYKRLPESRVLFICTFDPFGLGLPKYSFRERCDEDPGLSLKTGTEKVFFNCSYQGNQISEKLKNYYDYVMNGTATDELTGRIEHAVKVARKSEQWRSMYMKERALYMDLIETGISQGQITLKEAIQALHNGATREELLAKYDEATVNTAFECVYGSEEKK